MHAQSSLSPFGYQVPYLQVNELKLGCKKDKQLFPLREGGLGRGGGRGGQAFKLELFTMAPLASTDSADTAPSFSSSTRLVAGRCVGQGGNVGDGVVADGTSFSSSTREL